MAIEVHRCAYQYEHLVYFSILAHTIYSYLHISEAIGSFVEVLVIQRFSVEMLQKNENICTYTCNMLFDFNVSFAVMYVA
jgi:hypothetical protein